MNGRTVTIKDGICPLQPDMSDITERLMKLEEAVGFKSERISILETKVNAILWITGITAIAVITSLAGRYI